MKKVYILLLLLFSVSAEAQFGSQWVFGWHGCIDFTVNPPKVFPTQICEDTITHLNYLSPSG